MPLPNAQRRHAAIAQRMGGVKAAPSRQPGPYSGYSGYGVAAGSTYDPRLPSSLADWIREAGDLALNSVIAACIGWLQDNFASARLCVERHSGSSDGVPVAVPDHPILDMLGPAGRPNRDYGRRAFWAAMIRSWKCDGNAYGIVGRDAFGAGAPRALWWEPPQNVYPWRDLDSDNLVDCYYLLRPTGLYRLDPSRVLHLRDGIDPYNPLKGCARLKAGLRNVVGLNRAETYTAGVIGNGGIRKIFVPDGDSVDPRTAEQVQLANERATTGENAGRIPVASLPGHFEDAGSGPQEMALDTILDRPEATICALIGVQAMSAGLAVGANQRTFSNLGEADRMSWSNGMCPMQDAFAEQIGDQLLGQWGEDARGLALSWNRTKVEALQESKTEKVNRAVLIFTNRLAPLNESRAEAGLPAIEGKDDEWFAADPSNTIDVTDPGNPDQGQLHA